MKLTATQFYVSLIGSTSIFLGLFVFISTRHPERIVQQQDDSATETIAEAMEYVPIMKLERRAFQENGGDFQRESQKININAAGLKELQQLPNIGEKKAQAILEYRDIHGPFNDLQELTAIRGIGKKTVAKFQELAFCGPADSQSGEIGETAQPPVPSADVSSVEKDSSEEIIAEETGCGPGKININTADAGALTTLPGIGTSTADKIIEYRDTHGAFSNVSALKDVKGIGPKTLERLREYICAE
ncbi:ComEA family DNA-binding protein [bacterium]|nr:ComEA family DNA-binding protein [candidate division CSSED10-310 bacterium]